MFSLTNRLHNRRRRLDARKRLSPTALKVEALEARALLAAAIFDGVTLTLQGTPQADHVSVSNPSPNILQFDVGAGETIQLGAGATGNPNFQLSNGDQTLQVTVGPGGVSATSLNIMGDAGNDQVTLQSIPGTITTVGTSGDAGDDMLSAGMLSQGVVLDGGLGNDVLTGGAGNDRLLGGSGDDQLIGGDGNDELIGGFGADDLQGGDGNDRLIGGGQIEVTVTNLQTAGGALITPVFLATQNGVYDIFNVGSPASPSLESLAEDGATASRIAAALASGGVGQALATAGGPLMPGDTRTLTFFADPSNPLTQYLSYASMIIPSNDAFVANDDPLALDLFDAEGSLIRRTGAGAFIVNGSEVLDAGTEVNDEIPANTAALAQMAPNTGVTENGVIGTHPGFQGSQALGGPTGNVLTAIPNGDFTAPGSQILSLEIDAPLDGDDTLDGGSGDDILSGSEGNDTLLGGAGNDTLIGGEGDDLLAGGGGTDDISGGAGSDTNSFQGIGIGVTATVAADGTGTASYGAVNESFVGIENLTGSDNDDVLIATGAAANTLIGGAGNDLLAGGGGTDIIDGGAGSDTNSFQGIGLGVTATINNDGTGTASYGAVNESFAGIENLTGSANDDNLTGNDSVNVLDGGLGNDTLNGLGGNDRLLGGSGDDQLTGGIGDDELIGGFGADNLQGDDGNDRLIGGGQIEVTVTNLQTAGGALITPVFLATQNGVYDIFNVGSPASPSLESLAEDGATASRIAAALASGGVGQALATAGGPLMPGDTRTLTFFADPSNPLTQYLSYASMIIPSNDAFVANDDPLALDLFDAEGSLIRRTGAGAFIVNGSEVLDAGTEVNDEIPANTAALAQMAPNTGVTENGVIGTHPGFQGSQALGGPTGNVLTAIPNGDFTAPGSQILSLEIDAPLDGDDTLDGGSGDDILSGSEGNDTLLGGAGNDTLIGGEGDDLLAGGGGTDDISGGAGSDTNSFQGIGIGVTATVAADGTGTASYGAVNESFVDIENLTGSDNDDVLIATGAAANTLIGGAGNDLLAGGGGTDIIDGGAGSDTNSFQGIGLGVTATINNDGTGTASYGAVNETFAGIENLTGSANDDNLTGNDSVNVLDGGLGNDTLNGLGGNDRLLGGSDDDQLIGGDGDDELIGGFGADNLQGGDGNDRLIGGGQIEVTVTNLQTAGGALITPVFLATQNGVYDIFDVGSPASPSLESLAEDGATASRIAAALASGGVGQALATAGGPLMPGDTRTLTFFADPSNPLTQYLSYASMIIPSNDAFVANDDPLALDLFDAEGSLIRRTGAGAFIVNGSEVLDAGTEVNDEIPANTAALAQMAPNTGVTENGVIGTHPGFQGSQALGGPTGNVLTAIPNGDFTAPGSQILSLEIDAPLDGDDTLDGGSGDDILSGSEGNDTLLGGAGNDTLIGGEGDDLLAGGGGTDDINGGAGSDTNSFQGIGIGVTATVAADGTGTASYGAVNESFVGIENLTGSDNDDVLIATGAAANTLIGGAGNDLLAGGGGTDIIDGGAGSDTNSFQGIGLGVTATINNDGTGTASYGAVNESFAGIENLTGSANDDNLTGNDSVNVLDGGLGNDTLNGLGGNDRLLGGSGDDQLTGGIGDDELIGGFGADDLQGGDGNDRLIGGGQIEVTVTNLQTAGGALITPVFLATQNGVYDIFNVGSPASPSLESLAEDGATASRIAAALASGGVGQALATAGGPLMPGDTRTLTFFADPSNPLTQYLSYASMIIPSNDAFVANDDPLALDLFDAEGSLIRRTGAGAFIVNGSEVLDAGTEVNDEIPANTAALAQMAPNTGVTENGVIGTHPGFQGSQALGGPTGNVLTAIPNGDFTAPGSQILSLEIDAPLDGDDTLDGGSGDDILSGSEGNDTLLGGAGNDTLIGGEGDDLLAGGGGTDDISGGAGSDTNSFQGIGIGVTATVAADGTGTASYGAVNESFVGIENLTGSDNDDVLIATGAAANTLIGGAGNDLLAGGGGTDIIDGGAGSDTNSFQGIGLGVTATINNDGTGTASYGAVNETFAGIENLIGSENDDSLTGNAGVNLLDGRGGNDILDGVSGDDVLLGGPGNDNLSGGEGDDVLRGEAGNDQLDGGPGSNTLDGGPGNDVLDGVPEVAGLTLLSVDSIAGPVVVPAGSGPIAIPFTAAADTTVSITPVGTLNVAQPGFRILDGALASISQLREGSKTAEVQEGQSSLLFFDPSDTPQIFFVRSSAGRSALQLNTGAFTNSVQPTDVNGDGEASPLDALQVINLLNNRPRTPEGEFVPQAEELLFYDVSTDGTVSPLDVLLIVNALNRRAAGEGESLDSSINSVPAIEGFLPALQRQLRVDAGQGNRGLANQSAIGIAGAGTQASINAGADASDRGLSTPSSQSSIDYALAVDDLLADFDQHLGNEFE